MWTLCQLMNAGNQLGNIGVGIFFVYFFFPQFFKSCTHSLHTSRFCHHLLAKTVVVRIDQLASSDVWGWWFWRFSNSRWDNAYSHSRGGTKHLQGALNSLLTPAIEEYSGQFPCGLLNHYCLANSGEVALSSNSCRHSI